MRHLFGTFPTWVWATRWSDPVSISPVFHPQFQLWRRMNLRSPARDPPYFLSFSWKMFLYDCRPLRYCVSIFIDSSLSAPASTLPGQVH